MKTKTKRKKQKGAIAKKTVTYLSLVAVGAGTLVAINAQGAKSAELRKAILKTALNLNVINDVRCGTKGGGAAPRCGTSG